MVKQNHSFFLVEKSFDCQADEESSDFGDEGEDNPWEDQMKEAVEEKQNEVGAGVSLENPTDALFEDFEEDEGPAVPVRDLVDFAKKGRVNHSTS